MKACVPCSVVAATVVAATAVAVALPSTRASADRNNGDEAAFASTLHCLMELITSLRVATGLAVGPIPELLRPGAVFVGRPVVASVLVGVKPA